jgi:tellurite methyltransferase
MGDKKFLWGTPASITYEFMGRINLPKNSLVLDIGCADGRNSFPFAEKGFKVDAVDPLEEHIILLEKSLKNSKLKKNITVYKKDFFDFNPKKKYDVILCIGVLHYMSKKEGEKAIKKMKSLLKSRGYIVMTAFMRDKLVSYPKENMFFKKSELKKFFSGWKFLKYKEGPLFSHAAHGKKTSKDPDSLKEHYHFPAKIIVQKP